MLCFIYKSPKKDQLYLYVDKKDDFSAVPEALISRIGEPEFVMQLELTADRKLAHEDAKQVIMQLQNQGYFVQMPPSISADTATIQ